MKFSIRDVLWLILVCALGLGWGRYSGNMQEALHSLDTKNDERLATIMNLQLKNEELTKANIELRKEISGRDEQLTKLLRYIKVIDTPPQKEP